MNVIVRYHGIIGDMLRRKTQQVEMPDGATVTDLLAKVTGGDDGAQSILKQTRAFIDGKQADRTMPLVDGAEVTFMRPIAGGAGYASGGVAFGLGGEGDRRQSSLSSCTPCGSVATGTPLKPQRG
jgi:molybdopterin converting factor small subunit